MNELLEPFVGPAAVTEALAWAVIEGGELRSGTIGCEPAAIFDLASLTKVLGTVSTVAILLEEGALKLEQPIGELLPETHASLAAATVADLLHHRAGLLAFSETLAEDLEGRPSQRLAGLRHRVAQLPLKHRPGSVVYSDLGFILLSWICSRLGRPVDASRQLPGWPRFVVPPLDRQHPICYFLPSGRCADGHPLLARVNDPTCRAVGAVGCGHAGWYGTIGSVACAARGWLDLACGRSSYLPAAARQLIARDGSGRTAGFDVPTPGGTTGGGWSDQSFGHLGYTGTAMWIDPAADRAAVLLSNRTWPDGSDRGIGDLRRAFFGAVAAAPARVVDGGQRR